MEEETGLMKVNAETIAVAAHFFLYDQLRAQDQHVHCRYGGRLSVSAPGRASRRTFWGPWDRQGHPSRLLGRHLVRKLLRRHPRR